MGLLKSLSIGSSPILRLFRGQLARDFSLALATNLALLVVAVVTSSLQARLLGPDGRGYLAAIQMWALFLMNLGHLGIPTALAYYTGRSSRSSEAVGSYITTSWISMMPLALLWVWIGWSLLPEFLDGQPADVVRSAQLFMFILPLAYISRVSLAFQGLKSFGVWAIFRLQKPLLFVVLLVILGLTGSATPFTVSGGFVAISLASPVLVLYLLRHAGIRLYRPTLSRLRELLDYGLRSVVGTVPEALNTRVDQMFMVFLLSAEELGLYVVAVSWSLALGPAVQAIGDLAFPYVAAMEKAEDATRFFATSVRTSFFVIILATLLLMAATPIAFPLLFGADFAGALPVALVLLVASAFFGLRTVMNNGLRGLGYPEGTAIAEIASLFVTVSLLIALLPRMGIMGAAIASLAAYACACLLQLGFVRSKTALSPVTLLRVQREDIRLVVSAVTQRFREAS